MLVPVISKDRKPLMPTTPSRAYRWIKSGKATPFWSKEVFCVRLNVEPSGRKTQEVVVGIDPGSKREAFTVKSKSHTYLNVLTNAVDWVKDKVETRRIARRARRQRNTPCRKNRYNRKRGNLPPSTRARWQLKLRIVNWLSKLYPISSFVVEDIKAGTKTGKRKWNVSFSPLEVGKSWFYSELAKLAKVELRQGYETQQLRNNLGLKKSNSKLADKFECHNVDSWVLANDITGGHTKPENKEIHRLVPLNYYRRQLHRFKFDESGERKNYGGTMSLGLKRGSLVKHKKHGLVYIGGSSKNRVSLHNLSTGKRLSTDAKIEDIEFLSYNSFRFWKIDSFERIV